MEYTVSQLAEKLGVTTRSVRNYIKENKLTGTKIGGQWRFTDQDIQAFLNHDQPISGMLTKEIIINESPVLMKFNFNFETKESLNELREEVMAYHQDVYANNKDRRFYYQITGEKSAEFMIGGNFNYVNSFGSWIHEAIQTKAGIM